MLRVVFVQASKIEVTKESENAAILFIASPESMALAGGVWGGSRRPAIADVLAVAKPRGILLCPGRHAEHRAILLMSCPCEASRANACLGRTKSRGYCFASGGRSLAPISSPVRVALSWSYEARVEPAQRCENNFTSERQWASRIFTVSRRSPARGN